MKPVARIALALLALAATSAPVMAKEAPWTTKAISDKPQPFVPDPGKAYILVQADYTVNGLLMRRPDAADQEKWAAERAEKLAKEHNRWVSRHASWAATAKAIAASKSKVPAEPVEPTEENFQWPSYEQTHTVYFGPTFRFAKIDTSLYLMEVPAGEYVFYGNFAFAMPQGTCACMGTVAFDAKAGEVTAMGKLHMPVLDYVREKSNDAAPKDPVVLPEGMTTMRISTVEQAAYDARIPRDRIVLAKLKPVGRMPNWFGAGIDRLMPIDGVFRYERDRQIDLTLQGPAVASSAIQPTAPEGSAPSGQ